MTATGGHWIELNDAELLELAVDNLPASVVEKAARVLEPLEFILTRRKKGPPSVRLRPKSSRRRTRRPR
jgi:hypothetical protein